MLTAFGKELRKLRVDNNELIKDMAKKLMISPSYVSAIERGDRPVPDDLISKIGQAYELNKERLELLENMKSLSVNEVKINLDKMDDKTKEFAVLLARNFEGLNSESMRRIRDIFNGCEVDDVCSNK